MPPASFLDPVSSVLHGIARRFGMEAKLLEYRLRHCWHDIAGAHVAAHTRPDQIRFKKLYLIAEDSVWLQQLTYLKPALIDKINQTAGNEIVTDIVLRVGEVNEGKSKKAKGKSGHRIPFNLKILDARILDNSLVSDNNGFTSSDEVAPESRNKPSQNLLSLADFKE
jgi:hypothetical protein